MIHVFVALLAQEMAWGYVWAEIFKWIHQNVAEDVAEQDVAEQDVAPLRYRRYIIQADRNF